MQKNEPNKIVNRLFKRFLALTADNVKATDDFYTQQTAINKELANITAVVGAIEVMSKRNIIRLCAMQSSWRFMPLHSFLIYFSKSVQYTK